MQLSELEFWEKEAQKLFDTEPEFDWVEEAMRVLRARPEQSRFDSRLYDEPFSLGWIHQASQSRKRRKLYDDHVQNESKIEGVSDTTQIYTPRWVADFLVRAITPQTRSFLDPCCGTGQLLLAAFDRFLTFGLSPEEAAKRVRGSDADPAVVSIARFIFERTLERHVGDEAERIATEQITVRDLFDGIERTDVIVTNPPYLGRRAMSVGLRQKVDGLAPFQHDLFSAVMKLCQESADEAIGIIAPQVFWFIRRYEDARNQFCGWGALSDFVLLGSKTFQTLSGEKSNAAAFIQRRSATGSTRFWDVRDLGTAEKRTMLIESEGAEVDVKDFDSIPGRPFVFWWSKPLFEAFSEMTPLGEWADIPGGQNKTGDNRRFVRSIAEISPELILKTDAVTSSGSDDARWVAYSKGGRFAPWWGNWDFVVDWSPEARNAYQSGKTSNLLREDYWFRRGLCYSDFSSVAFGVRYMPSGCVFDMTGPAIFVPDDDLDLLMGLMVALNSTPVREIVAGLNPSLHTQVRDVRRIPLPAPSVLREFSQIGFQLVEATQENRWAQVTRLEDEADRLVSEVYGVSVSPGPRHHRNRQKI